VGLPAHQDIAHEAFLNPCPCLAASDAGNVICAATAAADLAESFFEPFDEMREVAIAQGRQVPLHRRNTPSSSSSLLELSGRACR
jgi:hypothetical protein